MQDHKRDLWLSSCLLATVMVHPGLHDNCTYTLAWSDDCAAGKEVDVIDGKNLRRLALAYKVPIITTVAGAKATTSALAGMQKGPLHQVPLQDYFPEAAERSTVEFKIVG